MHFTFIQFLCLGLRELHTRCVVLRRCAVARCSNATNLHTTKLATCIY